MSIDQQAHGLLKQRIDQTTIQQGQDKIADIHTQCQQLSDFVNKGLAEVIKKHEFSITELVEDAMRDLRLEVEQLREFCEFPDLTQKIIVGIGGSFSAGKSSLINAILDKKRLVTEVDPTTSLPTYLMQGDDDQITVVNHHAAHIDISQDEFLILTHSEKEKYGSSIGENLRVAFIKDAGFQWQNVALLDTPGYSSSEMEHSARTDAKVARAQLNTAQLIVWVVAIDNGTISEEDLNFLSQLHNDIPKLIVISRADKKQPEDVNAVVDAVRQSLASRELDVLDVVAVSARKNKDFPITPVLDWLDTWNNMEQQEPTFPKALDNALDRCFDLLLSQKQNYPTLEIESLVMSYLRIFEKNIDGLPAEMYSAYFDSDGDHFKVEESNISNETFVKAESSLKCLISAAEDPNDDLWLCKDEVLEHLESWVSSLDDLSEKNKTLVTAREGINGVTKTIVEQRIIFLNALSVLGELIGYKDWSIEKIRQNKSDEDHAKGALAYKAGNTIISSHELEKIINETCASLNKIKKIVGAPTIYDFNVLLYGHKDKLNDDSYVYSFDGLESGKARRKIQGAIKSYANEYGSEPDGELLLLIDLTTFGSGNDGFYITEDELYAKPLFEDSFSIRLKDIKRVRLDTDDRIIKINSQELSYTHSEINRAMKILVDCLKEYIKQFSEE